MEEQDRKPNVWEGEYIICRIRFMYVVAESA